MAKLLIVEDDANLAYLLSVQLEQDGNVVDSVASGKEALERVASHSYDLVVLDWMLPDLTGLEVCRRLRAAGRHLPVIMLTCKNLPEEKAQALDAGADDYMVKPFHPTELLARLRALSRRPRALIAPTLRFRDIELDVQAKRAYRAGVPIELMPREYALLELFLRNPKHTFDADAILDRLWHSETTSSGETVRTHIKTLRQKIGDTDGTIIVTRRGLGYGLGEASTQASNAIA